MLGGLVGLAMVLACVGTHQADSPLGSPLGSLEVRRFSGDKVDLGAIRGRYVVVHRVNGKLTEVDMRLADRLVRIDSGGMALQVCVLSNDSVEALASLVSVQGVSPVLYSIAGDRSENPPPGDTWILNPNGFVIAVWHGVRPEALPEEVEGWFRRDAPRVGATVPSLPIMDGWGEGNRLLLFLSTKSPVVDLYVERIRRIAAEAKKVGILTYGVFPEASETDEGVAAFARASEFEFLCVRDVGGVLAGVCGVKVAPTAVLLDEHGRVQYAGAIDSSTFGGDEVREYLLSAIRAVAAGSVPAVRYARPFGTAISVYHEGG